MPRSPSPTPISKVPRTLNSLPPHRSARGPVKRMPPTSPAKVTALIRPSCSPLSPALPPRSTRRVVRKMGMRFTALGTGMKLLDDSAQARIGLPIIVRVDVVHNLVAVVVHLNSAMRTNHFVGLSHNGPPCLQAS